MKKTLLIGLVVIFGVSMVAVNAMATTTIGTNISTGGTLTVTGASTLTGLLTVTAGLTSGSNLISDTDSTDSLGSTGVRWANVYADGLTGNTITLDGATGVNTLTVTDNVADALSIVDASGDLLVFTTTTGSEVMAVTPNSTFAGTLGVTGATTLTGLLTTNGDITMSNGATLVNTDANTLTVTEASTVFSGDVTITGDDLVMTTNTSGAVLVADGTNFNPVVMSGDATIGADGAVAIAANAVQGTDIALASEATGDIMYSDGTDWVRLPVGTALQVLRTNAGATAPEWATAISTLDNTSAWTAIQKLDAGITVDTTNFIVDGANGNVTTAGTLNVAGLTTVGANIISDTDSTDDLGATGTRWANIYADGLTGNTIALDGGTGVNTLTITDNVADALSIVDSSGDLIVFNTTTGSEVIAVTATSTTFSGDITVTGNEIVFGNAETISNAVDGTISFGAANLTTTGLVIKSLTTDMTALAGGAQAGTAIASDINVVTTVATGGDSVQLPTGVAGMEITIINRAAANSMNVFPQTGGNINEASADAAYAVAAKVMVKCIAIDTTTWECQKMAR